MTHNDLKRTITQALDEMKKEQGVNATEFVYQLEPQRY